MRPITMVLVTLLSGMSTAWAGDPEPAVTLASVATAPAPDALLGFVDENLTFSTRTSTIRMTVVNPRRTRIYVLRTMGRGQTEAAVEYLEPARDQGTRMLRRGDELWTWLPSVEKTQKISGHMLRQGLMGSDLSYEDLLGASKLRDAYAAKVTASELRDGRPCWRVELTAKDDTVAYPRRVAWIDQETRVPVEQELYALSGLLLKTWTMTDVQTVDGTRRFPMKMVIVDHLQEGTSTTVEITELKFGVTLEDEVFSLRWLERR